MRLDLLRVLALASVMSALGAFAEETSVDLETYAHEMRITVSGYSGSETLTDFPLLVRLSEKDVYRFRYSDFQSDGKDIRFALADGTVQTVDRPIVVSGTSAIRLGAGARLTVADCTGAEWADGAELDIVGEVGDKSVCFGPNGLTRRQVRMIRVNGRKVGLDDEGYLVTRGLTMMVR